MSNDRWPALPYDAWRDTRETLHMWLQIVGKIALACAPPLNHCWGVSLHLGPRGLSTRPLAYGERIFTIAFDFVEHRLVIDTTDGEQRMVGLYPRSVADFYREVMATLAELGVPVKIWTTPVELPPGTALRFESDTVHHSYEPADANRFWRILVEVERVLSLARCRFVGKASPAHFFWGSMDLALTRFSGRPANPPPQGPAFMRDAYSHEVISHGFWPGSPPVLEPAFYAYAAPVPLGLEAVHVEPAAAAYRGDVGEFILPYESMRRANDPDADLAAFIQTTYAGAADLAGWDRVGLER